MVIITIYTTPNVPLKLEAEPVHVFCKEKIYMNMSINPSTNTLVIISVTFFSKCCGEKAQNAPAQ